MKSNKVFLFCLLAFFQIGVVFGQKSMPKRDTTYFMIKDTITGNMVKHQIILPAFPTGKDGFTKYLRKMRTPTVGIDYGIGATVFVQFMVELDGTVADARVVRIHKSNESAAEPPVSTESIYFPFQTEALYVISTMPRWWVGLDNGVPARVPVTLGLGFGAPQIRSR